MTWKPGQSGNPKGKPRGARHKATTMVMALMEKGAKDITEAVIEQAKRGDVGAAKLILDRLAPPVRERAVSLELPDTSTAEGVAAAQGAILQAVSSGELYPTEAATLVGVVEARRKSIETVELAERLELVERTLKLPTMKGSKR